LDVWESLGKYMGNCGISAHLLPVGKRGICIDPFGVRFDSSPPAPTLSILS